MPDGTSHAIPFDQELVVDLFAGGGGASTGIAAAYREPDVAVNHNAIAVAVHRANHPNTKHYQEDVFEVDPLTATQGRPVGLLWASPDCRHHSKAKGGKPRSKRIRGLAWVVLRWALACRPRVIELENVEEFTDWGPLDADDNPVKARKGETFRAFVAALSTGLAADHPAMAEIREFLGPDTPVAALVRGLGYNIEWRELRACDYKAPTIRKRLYIKARCDGRPIAWSAPTHGKPGSDDVRAGRLHPHRTAAECIDWTLPAKSIFARKKPLAVNTQRRIAKGLWRYVLTTETPYIVPTEGSSHSDAFKNFRRSPDRVLGGLPCDLRVHAGVGMLEERRGARPRGVVCGSGDAVSGGRDLHLENQKAYVAPFLTEHANASSQRVFPADEPLRTQVAQVKGGHFALVAPTLVQTGYGERAGQEPRALDLGKPLGTVVAGGVKHALVSAFLEQANGGYYDGDGHDMRESLSTVCTSGANQRLVSAYLVKYYREGGQWQDCREPMHTVPTKHRMGLVQVVQVAPDIIDPALRERAKAVADFLHEHLPEHFPEPADMVLLGGYVLADITLRMLVPRELARAQGFPDSYILDRGLFETAPGSGEYEWRPVTKTDQVRLIGNSVCPDVAEANIRVDLADLIALYARAAA